MTDNTHYMLCNIFAVVAGYPDEIMSKYADVFKIILDNDKLLDGLTWDSHRVYENKYKYFERGNKK